MKYLIIILFLSMIFIACSKSHSANVLEGKWKELRMINQYTNPYTLNTEYDTSAIYGNVEFKSDGNVFTNGSKDGTYSMSGDTVFTLTPIGGRFTIITVGNGILKTRRNGHSGEQKKFLDADLSGMFRMANIEFVFTEYQKL